MLSVWHHNNNTKEQVRSSACSLLPQNIYLPDPHFLTHTLYRSKQHATALQQGALLAVLLASHNTPSIAKMQSPRLVTKAPLSHVSLHYPRPRRATRVLRLARASNAGDSNLTSFEGVASPPSPELVAAVEAPNGPGMISNDPTQHGSNPFAAISASYAASLSANPVGTKAFTSLVGFMGTSKWVVARTQAIRDGVVVLIVRARYDRLALSTDHSPISTTPTQHPQQSHSGGHVCTAAHPWCL